MATELPNGIIQKYKEFVFNCKLQMVGVDLLS